MRKLTRTFLPLVVFASLAACHHGDPLAPDEVSLSGKWHVFYYDDAVSSGPINLARLVMTARDGQLTGTAYLPGTNIATDPKATITGTYVVGGALSVTLTDSVGTRATLNAPSYSEHGDFDGPYQERGKPVVPVARYVKD